MLHDVEKSFQSRALEQQLMIDVDEDYEGNRLTSLGNGPGASLKA